MSCNVILLDIGILDKGVVRSEKSIAFRRLYHYCGVMRRSGVAVSHFDLRLELLTQRRECCGAKALLSAFHSVFIDVVEEFLPAFDLKLSILFIAETLIVVDCYFQLVTHGFEFPVEKLIGTDAVGF